MSDFTAARLAALGYEREAPNTAPFHATVLEEVVDAALAVVSEPRRWLDTGCGPGRLAELARARAPGVNMYLADPSEGMLAFARTRHADLSTDRFLQSPTHALPDIEPVDVVTAVLCHHFYREEAGRAAALRRCRALLRPGGVFVTVEIVRAETDAGHALQRRRWEGWQRRHGRAEEQIAALLDNEGHQYFPLRASALRAAIEAAGFSPVEMMWRAYSLAGFVAVAAG
jgi:tRNA (cmo5U34)-methyltransferase